VTASGTTSIEAVLLDFGGVFTTSPFEALRSLADDRQIDFDEAMSVMFGPYDRDTDHPWHCLERGELDLESCREAVRVAAEEAGFELDLFAVLERMGSGGGVRPDVVERVAAIRAGGRVTALVTNNAAEFRVLWRSLVPLDDLFDAVVDSSEVGIRKPDPRIFLHTLDQLGNVDAANSVFLDDYEGNVIAARRLGMHGIVVDPDHVPAFDELDLLLDQQV
jgi:epoxide hydrolase-like predicted phosphatase